MFGEKELYICAYILWNDEAAQPTAEITDSLKESNTEKRGLHLP